MEPWQPVLLCVALILAAASVHGASCNRDAFVLSPELLGKAVGREPSWCVVDAAAVAEPQSECVMYTQLINAALRDAGMACPTRAAAYLAVVSRYTFAMSDVEGLPPPRGWVRTACRGRPQLGLSEQLAAFPYPDDCDAGPDACGCGDTQDELSVGARPRNNFAIWAWALSDGARYLFPDTCHDLLAAADAGEGEAGDVTGKGGGASGDGNNGPWNPDDESGGDSDGMTWKQREAVWRSVMRTAKQVAKEGDRRLAASASATGVHHIASCVGFADTSDIADAYNMALHFLSNGDNFDTQAPTGALECRNCEAGTPTRADPLTFLATFDEQVVLQPGAATASSGTVTALSPAPASGDAAWYFEVHGAAEGELVVAVAAVLDAALNAGPGNAPVEFRTLVDHTGPTAVLSTPTLATHDGVATTNSRAVPFTVTFSEASTVEASGVHASSGSVHGLTAAGGDVNAFAFVVTDPVADGTLTVTVGGAADVAGNPLVSSSNTVAVVMDSVAPTVVSLNAAVVAGKSVAGADEAPEVHVTVVFSELVVLTMPQLVSSSGTVESLSPVDSKGTDAAATTFMAVITGTDHGVLVVSVVAAADPAGNALAAPSSVEVTVDMQGPSAYLATALPADALVGGTTAATTVPFTLTLSEPGQLEIADISSTTGTVSDLVSVPAGEALAATWSFDVVGAADGPLVVGVTRVVDAAGNVGPFNAPVAEVVVVDTVGPSGTLHSPESGKVASSETSPAFTCQFDEPAALAAGDITTSSGTVSKLTPIGDAADGGVAKTWGWLVTGAEDGALTVSVDAATDAVGNSLREPVTPLTINLLRSPPRVLSVKSAAVMEAGTNSDPLVVTATFSRAVVLRKDGIVASSGYVTNLRPAGEASYTFQVVGLEQGVLHVSVMSATDAAGNQLVLEGLADASPPHVLTTVVDTVSPTVESFASAAGSGVTVPGNTAFLLQLSEPGRVAADLVTVTGAKGSYVTGAAPENADGSLWRLSLRALSEGAISVTVPAAAVTDLVGNVCDSKAARATVVVDSRGPFVMLTSPDARLAVTSADPVVVTASFSEPVTMSASDAVVSSGTVSAVDSRGATTTFEVWGSRDGRLTVTLRPSLADPAGNTLAVAPTPLSFHVDRTPPTVKAMSSLADNPSVDPLPVLVTMSEPVSMRAGSIAASSGTVSAPVAAGTPAGHDGSLSTAWLVDVSGAEAGALRVWVAEAVDGAGLALVNAAEDGGEPVPELSVTVTPGAAGGFALMAESPVHVVGVDAINIVIRCSSPSVMTIDSLNVSAGRVSAVQPSPPPAGGSSSYRFRLSELPEGLITTTLVSASTPDGVDIDTTGVPPTVFRVDLTPPTVIVTSPGADAAGVTSASPVPILLSFSEPVALLPTALTASTGVLGVLLPVVVETDGTATEYTTQVSSVSDGPLRVTVAATGVRDAGGHNMGADVSEEFTVATIAPALVSLRVVDAATHAPVPVNAEGMVVTKDTDFVLEATYSAAVALSMADVTPSSGTVTQSVDAAALAAAAATPGATVWRVSLSGVEAGALEVTLAATLPSAAAGVGGGSLAPDTRVVAFVDLTPPSVALSVVDDGTPAVFKLEATFSEPVTGFTAAGVTASVGTVSEPTSVVAATAGTQYSFTVTVPADAAATAGELTVQVAQGAASDVVGWPSAASEAVTVVTADRDPPTVESASVVGGVGAFVPGDVMELWITFSEAVVVDEATAVVADAAGVQTVTSTGSVVKVQYRFHAQDKPGRVAFRVVVTDIAGNSATFTSLPLTPPLFGCSPCEGGDLVHAVCVAFTDTVCRLAAPRLFPLRGAAPLDVRVATASAGRPGGASIVVTSGGEQAVCDMLPVDGTTWVFASAHDAKFTLPEARDDSLSVVACPAPTPLSAAAEAMAFAAAVSPSAPSAELAALMAGDEPHHVPGYASAARVLVTPAGSDDGRSTVTWDVPLTGLTASDVTPTLHVELVEALASDVLVPGYRVSASFEAPVELASATGSGQGEDGGDSANDATGARRVAEAEVVGDATGSAGDSALVHAAAAATRRCDATFVFTLEPLASEPGVEAEPLTSVLGRVQDVVGSAHLPGAVDGSAFVAALVSAGGSLANGGMVTVDLRSAEDGGGSEPGDKGDGGLGDGEDGAPVTPPPPPGNTGGVGDGQAGQAGTDATTDPPLPTDLLLGSFAGVVLIALVALAVYKARRNQQMDRVVALNHSRSRVEWGPDRRIPKMVHRGYGFGSLSSLHINDSMDSRRGRGSLTSPRAGDKRRGSRSKKRGRTTDRSRRKGDGKRRVRRGRGRAQDRDVSSPDSSMSPPPPPPAELDAPMQPVGVGTGGVSPVAGADEWDTRAEQRRELVKVNSWVSTSGEATRAAEATSTPSRNPAARLMGWLFGGNKRRAVPRDTALGVTPALSSAGRGNSFNSAGSGASSGTSDASSVYSDGESDCDSVGDSKAAAPSGLSRSSSRPGSAAHRSRDHDSVSAREDASPAPACDGDDLDGSHLLRGLEPSGWSGGNEGLLISLDADDQSFINSAVGASDSGSDFGSDSGGSSVGGAIEERAPSASPSRPGSAALSASRGSHRPGTAQSGSAPRRGSARSGTSRPTSPQAADRSSNTVRSGATASIANDATTPRPSTGAPGRRRSHGYSSRANKRRPSKQSAHSAPAAASRA